MSNDAVSPQTDEAMRRAANRLHHLSMRYVGSLVELVSRQPVVLLASGLRLRITVEVDKGQ